MEDLTIKTPKRTIMPNIKRNSVKIGKKKANAATGTNVVSLMERMK
jgi:hypothetical protein